VTYKVVQWGTGNLGTLTVQSILKHPRAATSTTGFTLRVWLERGGQQLSSLDLLDGTRFSLLTGIGGDGWSEAARVVKQTTGVGVEVHVIGGRDAIVDVYGDWQRLRGVGPTGCVLVRPDRHVAWRTEQITADATGQLQNVMRRLLSTTPARSRTEEVHHDLSYH
jgi:2,4-dichlorophenol 6-monooxygenase